MTGIYKIVKQIKNLFITKQEDASFPILYHDFEELKDINTNLQKDNKVIKVLLILILLFMVANLT